MIEALNVYEPLAFGVFEMLNEEFCISGRLLMGSVG
jgi:hypothetical protein